MRKLYHANLAVNGVMHRELVFFLKSESLVFHGAIIHVKHIISRPIIIYSPIRFTAILVMEI
jgi:hypothetical protein